MYLKQLGVILFFFVGFSLHSQIRIKKTINTDWQFYKGELIKESDPINWENVTIPHTWNTDDVMDDEPEYYRGVAYYRKQLFIPMDYEHKNVYIYFEGANQETEVLVNGISVGKHIGGYTAFSFNITEAVKYGAENELIVMITNQHNEAIPPLAADFTFYGGIYRDVYVVVVNPTHFDMDNLASDGVFITTPKVSESAAIVHIKGKITKNDTDALALKTEVWDSHGQQVAATQFRLTNTRFSFDLPEITRPKLWSPEFPNLYVITHQLINLKSNKVIDEISTSLGLRWFKFDADTGFYLNGKSLKLIGASRHQDYKDLGNALPDELHVKDVALLKEMGANFLRVAHYPQDPAVMEACDRLGILTIVETPGNNRITESKDYEDNSIVMQREMIRQNYNYSSVIMWGYMNEVLLHPRYPNNSQQRKEYVKKVAALAQKIENVTREEDPNRYTMMACHGNFDLYNDAGMTQIPMVLGWNLYQGWYGGTFNDFDKFLQKHHKKLPNMPMIVSEYGADSDIRLHSFSPKRFDKTQEYTNEYHTEYLKAILKNNFVAGAVIWNLVEFNSETRQEAVPHINNKGIMSSDRAPKDTYWFYTSHLVHTPFGKIGSKAWNHRGMSADLNSETIGTQNLDIYTNLKKVQLFLNDKILQADHIDFNIHTYQVPFQNGNNRLLLTTVDHVFLDEAHIDFKVIPQMLQSKENPFTYLNVSLGDFRMYTDTFTQEVWLPEKPYEKGSWGYVGGEVYKDNPKDTIRYGSSRSISGSYLDAMYETQRENLETFKADVPKGVYRVTLHFAELYAAERQQELLYNLSMSDKKNEEQKGNRIFNVYANKIKIEDYLSNSNYLKPFKAYKTSFNVTVNDTSEGITIDFEKITGASILNGIQIRKLY
tara:strand:+ start:6555 stop:9209 length:2655 start_codon:yes stop_codon:yes gene_type:complete